MIGAYRDKELSPAIIGVVKDSICIRFILHFKKMTYEHICKDINRPEYVDAALEELLDDGWLIKDEENYYKPSRLI